MTKLSKYEKETIINWNEAEDTASIYTFNADLKRRLAEFSRKYPQLCRLEHSTSLTAKQNPRKAAPQRPFRGLQNVWSFNLVDISPAGAVVAFLLSLVPQLFSFPTLVDIR